MNEYNRLGRRRAGGGAGGEAGGRGARHRQRMPERLSSESKSWINFSGSTGATGAGRIAVRTRQPAVRDRPEAVGGGRAARAGHALMSHLGTSSDEMAAFRRSILSGRVEPVSPPKTPVAGE